MIKFQCPSGHPLTAPEELAGKAGKCPKCGASFVVPAANSESVSGIGSAVRPAMGSGKNLTGGGEIFVFLCPNGHKLNGPPSLKGKPGQCPHCGARFMIPTDDDLEDAADEPPPEEEADEEALEYSPPQSHDSGHGGINFNHLLGGNDEEASRELDRPPTGAAGLGFIVARLWERRSDGSELEIFLSEGEIIAPDYFAGDLSTSDYGVFAVREGDGSFAISVVPWSSVRRVGLRRMTDLPDGLFS